METALPPYHSFFVAQVLDVICFCVTFHDTRTQAVEGTEALFMWTNFKAPRWNFGARDTPSTASPEKGPSAAAGFGSTMIVRRVFKWVADETFSLWRCRAAWFLVPLEKFPEK